MVKPNFDNHLYCQFEINVISTFFDKPFINNKEETLEQTIEYRFIRLDLPIILLRVMITVEMQKNIVPNAREEVWNFSLSETRILLFRYYDDCK